jgi:L-threonylcarbamoyladenylate synthase
MKPESARAAQANNIGKVSPETISHAVRLLQGGEVIGLPTETVYGLAGDGLNPSALARIFEVKQRPLFDPLILHIADAAAAWKLAADVPDPARKLAGRFWPGPLTLVLPKREHVPDLATSGLPHVALRVPSHPAAQAVLRAFGGPLAAPSANRFGRISPTDAAAVRAELGDAVPLILDGGPCAVGLESTVLQLSAGRALLLRAGGVPVEEIEALIGPVERPGPVEENPAAPGQLKHHYAPRKPLRIVQSIEAAAPQTGWLIFGKESVPVGSTSVVENLSPTGDLREAAANFFRALRRLDENPRVEALAAISLPPHNLGLAMNERLARAAH